MNGATSVSHQVSRPGTREATYRELGEAARDSCKHEAELCSGNLSVYLRGERQREYDQGTTTLCGADSSNEGLQ